METLLKDFSPGFFRFNSFFSLIFLRKFAWKPILIINEREELESLYAKKQRKKRKTSGNNDSC